MAKKNVEVAAASSEGVASKKEKLMRHGIIEKRNGGKKMK